MATYILQQKKEHISKKTGKPFIVTYVFSDFMKLGKLKAVMCGSKPKLFKSRGSAIRFKNLHDLHNFKVVEQQIKHHQNGRL